MIPNKIIKFKWSAFVLVGGCRTRRRQAREQNGKRADHKEGLSSDDEETSTDITSFNMEKGQSFICCNNYRINYNEEN